MPGLREYNTGDYRPSDGLLDRIAEISDGMLLREIDRALETTSNMSIMEWAEKHRIIESGAQPGPFRGRITPYVHEIAESLLSVEPHHQVVICKKGTQLALSELAVNFIGRMVHQEPCQILYYLETGDKAEKLLKTRIRPMFYRQPFQFPPPGKGTGDNTRTEILYPGGGLQVFGAGSSTAFSTNPARIVILDELARYKLDISGEGDPMGLAKGRISSFGGKGKIYIPSTPVEDDRSQGSFETLYQLGDAREYYFPCPHCGHMDYARRDRFYFDSANSHAYMICEGCTKSIEERDKDYFLPRGEWRGTKERESYDVTSYRVPGLIAPVNWAQWTDIGQRMANAKRGKISLQAVLNTAFGEGYSEVVENAEPDFIQKNHLYKNKAEGDATLTILPEKTLFCTMSVDTQLGVDALGEEGVGL